MAKSKKVQRRVVVYNEHGAGVWLEVGDTVPDWAADQITNPKVFEAPESTEVNTVTGEGVEGAEVLDPEVYGEGPLEGRTNEQLQALGEYHDVDLKKSANKDELVASLQAAGVTE